MWVTGLAEDGQGGDFGKEGLQRLHEFLAAAWTVWHATHVRSRNGR
jgi:hypothetical protein